VSLSGNVSTTVDSTGGSGSCHFIAIDEDMSRMFMVAIISAVVSAPLTLSVQFIISNILSRDTITTEDRSNWRGVMSRKNLTTATSRKKLTTESADLEEVTGKSLKEDMKNFLHESNQHYQGLQGKDREEFAGKCSLPPLFPCFSSTHDHSRLGALLHNIRPSK
jgi:hypothetical protein